MEQRIRMTHTDELDREMWRDMCCVAGKLIYSGYKSLTFKGIYSNSGKLKGFEISAAGSSSVIGFINSRIGCLYIINRRYVMKKYVNLFSSHYDLEEHPFIRYIGNGMFEMGC